MSNSQLCLSDLDLRELEGNQVSQQKLELLESHLTTCGKCRDRLDEVDGQLHAQWHSEIYPTLRETFTASNSASGDDESSSHETFLQLLTPSDDPAMLGRIGVYEVAGITVKAAWALCSKRLNRH